MRQQGRRLRRPRHHRERRAEREDRGDELGGPALTALIVEESHTCYLGERSVRHAWGYGCGQCPACELRANGWFDWRASLEAAAS